MSYVLMNSAVIKTLQQFYLTHGCVFHLRLITGICEYTVGVQITLSHSARFIIVIVEAPALTVTHIESDQNLIFDAVMV